MPAAGDLGEDVPCLNYVPTAHLGGECYSASAGRLLGSGEVPIYLVCWAQPGCWYVTWQWGGAQLPCVFSWAWPGCWGCF